LRIGTDTRIHFDRYDPDCSCETVRARARNENQVDAID